jgi:hypothetical protein
MPEGTAPPAQTDGYIAARKIELAQAMTAAGGLSGADAAALPDVFKLLGAILNHQASEQLEALKALYDPLDPDAPLGRRDTGAAAFEAFEQALVAALERANFVEIDHDTVQTRDATKLLTGLSIKPSAAGIRRIRFFARGERAETLPVRSWLGLRRRNVEVAVMSDVIVLVGFKAESEISGADKRAFAHMRRGMRTGAALVKHFRNVATAELVTLHPGARPSMRPRDQVFLAAPAIFAGTPVLLNLWPALTVIFAVLAAYFGAQGVVDDDQLKRALAAVSGLVAVGAFVMRQRLKYEAQNLRYQKQLADTVYFRNLANNSGVIDLLVGAGEEQDAKEAFVAYWTLLRANAPMAKGELDMACEAFLREQLKLDLNFEIGDALAKLERLQLVTREAETYRAVSAQEALTRLDAAWDDVFKFSARR